MILVAIASQYKHLHLDKLSLRILKILKAKAYSRQGSPFRAYINKFRIQTNFI